MFFEVKRGFIDQDGWEELRGREDEFGLCPLIETIWG